MRPGAEFKASLDIERDFVNAYQRKLHQTQGQNRLEVGIMLTSYQ